MLEACFVTESVAVLVDYNVSMCRHAHNECGLKLRELVPHWRRDSIHVPQIRTKLLGESNAIAGISGIAIRENRIGRQKFLFELLVVLKPSCREHNCFTSADVKTSLFFLSCYPDNFIGRTNNPSCSRVSMNRYPTLLQILRKQVPQRLST